MGHLMGSGPSHRQVETCSPTVSFREAMSGCYNLYERPVEPFLGDMLALAHLALLRLML